MHIEKLSGDNTREEKERVMMALRTEQFDLSNIHIPQRLPKCAGMGSDIADIKLTVCIGNILASTCSVTSLWPGLPKDLWELSQMLGRGGRDGSQAAFVALVWVGQAGRLLLHA